MQVIALTKPIDMETRQLEIDIDHILESGANSIRLIELFKRYATKIALETLNESIVDLDLRPLSAQRKQQIIFKILSTPITLS